MESLKRMSVETELAMKVYDESWIKTANNLLTATFRGLLCGQFFQVMGFVLFLKCEKKNSPKVDQYFFLHRIENLEFICQPKAPRVFHWHEIKIASIYSSRRQTLMINECMHHFSSIKPLPKFSRPLLLSGCLRAACCSPVIVRRSLH